MNSDAHTPPADDFPVGQTGDMRDVLLSPSSGTLPAAAPSGPWQPPTAEELAKLLPQYEITRMLGRGGMGAVYQGTQKSLDRTVAIKILSNDLETADASFAERFKNEARAMARLSHPGIVAVFDSGETANGLLYIVMEFIEGTDVARMLAQNKRLHTEHAMAITAHVCDALAYAHERGIIHRDIKPANIMVGYDGVVKVADFGLAKMSKSGESGLTQSGMAMGTLHYMAPEALMLGSAVDHRADIYAVGVMLYQMLTGKIPQGLFELPSLQVPGLDPRYDGIIGKALREDRELRYPSVLNMRHDLDAILTQPVAKVEAAAAKPPAALETQARPQRPGGQPYRPPQQNTLRPAPSKSSSGMILAVVAMLVLAGAAASYFRGMDRGQVDQSEPSTNVVANGGDWIDLLPLADPQSDAVSGKWTRVAAGLHGEIIPGTKGAQVLQLPYEPPEEYDFRIAYTTLEGNREASQILSAFGHQFTWGTASGQPEKWSGFNMINGKPMMLNGAGVKLPAPREMNRRYESLVEVRRDRVTGYVDGEKLVEWKTDYSELSMDQSHAIPNPRALGIGIWWSKTVFHEIAVREVTGQGKRLREPDAAPVTTTVKAAPSPAEPAQATKEVPFVNSLGMKFVPVPGTNILMCVHETRRKDYIAYLAANPSVKSTLKSLQSDGTEIGSTDMHPACNLAWDEMQAFCAWLSKKDGRTFRLPTDREWSWAVGIGDKEESGRLPSELAAGLRGVYPWGTTWPPPPGSGNFSDASAAKLLKTEAIPGYQDGFGGLAPVMSFPPNALGIHDLAGNVWEWCSDWYDASRQTYVLRGGCYRDGGVDKGNCLRSADRISRTPNGRSASDGFRLVMEEKLVTATPAAITTAPVPAAKQGPVGVASSPPAPALSTGPTTWTDTKGRSITATFKAIASGNVLLDIAGKVTPVPLNTLSAESQKLALDYQQQAAPTPSDEASRLRALTGHWLQTNNGRTQSVFDFEIMPDGQTLFVGSGARVKGQMHIEGDEAVLISENGVGYRIKLPPGNTFSSLDGIGTSKDGKPPFTLHLERAAGSDTTHRPMPSAASSITPNDLAMATKDAPFTNSLGMKFVPVPGTKVLMCIHETRHQDYAAYAAAVRGVNSEWKNHSFQGVPYGHEAAHPVVGVSWDDARRFCRWLGGKEGLTYRMTSDEEWSHAVGIGHREKRAPETTPEMLSNKVSGSYPWGGAWPPPDYAGNFADVVWKAKFPSLTCIKGYLDGFPTSAPVMSFKPNELGLHDLGGNVWEMCEDWANDNKNRRLARGGSWAEDQRDVLLSSHRSISYGVAFDNFGFRCVIELP